MKALTADWEIAFATDQGPVVILRVEGDAESRRDGLQDVVPSILTGIEAGGIVFDLTAFSYSSWDDTGIHAIVEATEGGRRPCCVLSVGRNRRKLEHFLATIMVLDFLGGRVFANLPSALEYVRGEFDRRGAVQRGESGSES